MFHLIGTYDLEVSQNGGTPKSSIYKWILHHKPSILEIPILGNPNLNILKDVESSDISYSKKLGAWISLEG
jgi:hypothetical protein